MTRKLMALLTIIFSLVALTPAFADDKAEALTELERIRELQLQSLEALQSFQVNSLREKTDPAIEQITKNMQGILESPIAHSMTALLQKPDFTHALEQLVKSPKKMLLVYVQLGWFFLIILIRAWRLSIPAHWSLRLWTRFWTFGLYCFGAVILVPVVVLGPAYLTVLRALMTL